MESSKRGRKERDDMKSGGNKQKEITIRKAADKENSKEEPWYEREKVKKIERKKKNK